MNNERGKNYTTENINTKKEQVVLLALCRDTRIRTWDPLLPKQVR